MKLLQTFFLVMLAGLFGVPTAQAAAEGEELDPIHHSADGYYLDFMPIGKVELPRLFLVRRADGALGFDAYGSTRAALHSGAYIPEPEHDSELEDITHGDETAVDAELAHGAGVDALVASGHHLDAHLVPADGGHVIIDFSITRHLIFAILGGLLVVLIFTSLARKYARGIGRETAPRGVFQNLFETLVLFVRDDIARPNLGEDYRKYLPYLLTAFFFILICNLLGLVPFGATATSNLMLTAVLATFTFLMTQINASKDHWLHVFWPPGVPTFVKPILIPVEIMGLFTKPIALAIRLFANLTAGHLVILSLIGLIFSFANIFGPGVGYGVAPVSIAFSLFIYLLEILVAFIQAYIFTMLSALFIGMAVEEHAHPHDEVHEAQHYGELQPAEHAAPQPILSGNGAERQPVATA